MKRLAAILFVAGVLLLGLLLFFGLQPGTTAMPSYLAEWLFWSSLPFGALPVVMLLDLAGTGSGFALAPALRRLLLLTPIAALFMIPVLLHPVALFGWAQGHGFSTSFGQAWMTHGGFITRSIIYVVLWVVLALLFFWPPSLARMERRRGLAAIGLFVYALSATLAAADWAMSVEPDWFSAEYGLLFISVEVAAAISFAIVLADWRTAEPDAGASCLLIAVGVWIFTQFIQFLVIWSGNKVSDIPWYFHRADSGSRIAVWIGFVAGGVIPVMLLLSSRMRHRPWILVIAATLVFCAQALCMLWLITPSIRNHFTITGMDVLAFAGLGGVMAGICLWPGALSPPVAEATRHA